MCPSYTWANSGSQAYCCVQLVAYLLLRAIVIEFRFGTETLSLLESCKKIVFDVVSALAKAHAANFQ